MADFYERLCAIVFAAAVLCSSARVDAQACHGGSALPSSDYFSAELLLRGGLFDAAAGKDLEGIGVGLDASLANLHVGGDLAVYRLGLASLFVGVGDLALSVDYSFALPNSTWAISAGLAAGFPTGDSSKGVGMGMYMLTPSLTASFTKPKFALALTVGYATHLGEVSAAGSDPHAHHHHGGDARPTVSPSVDPHYHQELWLRPSATFVLSELAALSASLTGALEASEWSAKRLGVDLGFQYEFAPSWSLLGRADYRLSEGPHFAVLEVGARWTFR